MSVVAETAPRRDPRVRHGLRCMALAYRMETQPGRSLVEEAGALAAEAAAALPEGDPVRFACGELGRIAAALVPVGYPDLYLPVLGRQIRARLTVLGPVAGLPARRADLDG